MFQLTNENAEFVILPIMNCSRLGNATDVIHLDLLLFRPIYYSVSTRKQKSIGIGNSTTVLVRTCLLSTDSKSPIVLRRDGIKVIVGNFEIGTLLFILPFFFKHFSRKLFRTQWLWPDPVSFADTCLQDWSLSWCRYSSTFLLTN